MGPSAPTSYWAKSGSEFPRLRSLSLRLAVVCPSQVPSEQLRLFLAVSGVFSKTRKSLLPESLQKLVFLQNHLPIINHDYSSI
jgi:hypothetical protein